MTTPIDPRNVAPAVEKQGIIAMAKAEGILPAIGKLIAHHPVLTATAILGSVAAGFGIVKMIGGKKIESFAEKIGDSRKGEADEQERESFKPNAEVKAGAVHMNVHAAQVGQEQGAAR